VLSVGAPGMVVLRVRQRYASEPQPHEVQAFHELVHELAGQGSGLAMVIAYG
jgi:hypothetical protein